MTHKTAPQSQHLTPFVIATIYLILAALWEWLSGQLIIAIQSSQPQLQPYLGYQDWVFIALMALVIYALIRYNNNDLINVAERYRRGRELLHAILDSASNTFIYVKDLKGRYLLTSRGYEKLFDMTREEITGKTVYDLFPKDIADQSDLHDQQVIAQKQPLEFQESCSLADGLHTHVSCKFPLFDEQGECNAVCGIASDITDRIAIEERLREREELMRLTWENAHIGITTVDTEGRILTANPSYCKLMGYSEEELKNLSVADLTHPDDLPQTIKFRDALIKGEINRFEQEKRNLRKDGAIVYSNIHVAVVKDKEGNPIMTLCEGQDITQRKKTEEQLQKSEEILRLTLENSSIGISTGSLEGRLLSANARLCEILGYPHDELMRTRILDFIHPEQREAYGVKRQRLIEGEVDKLDEELQYVRKDGKIVTGHFRAGLVRDNQGNPLMVVGEIEDITQRKVMEEQLRRNEKLFRLTLKHAPIAIAVLDTEDRFISANPRLCEILGYTEEELFHMRHIHVVHPDDHYDIAELNKDITEDEFDGQGRYVQKDGGIIIGHIRSVLVRDDDGNPYIWVVQFEDITERLATDARLKESEELLRKTLDHAPIAIATVDLYDQFTSANPSLCEIIGYNEAELLKMQHLDIIHPEDRYDMPPGGQFSNIDVSSIYDATRRYVRKDGEIINAHIREAWILDANDQPQMYVAEFEDITESLATEAQLKQSEGLLRQTLTHAPIAIATLGLDDYFLSANPCLCEIVGYSEEELLQMKQREIIHPDDWYETLTEEEIENFDTGTIFDAQRRYIRKDGTVITAHARAACIVDANNKVQMFVVEFEDITERLAMEEKLRKGEQLFRLTLDNAPIGISLAYLTGKYININPAYCKLLGYTKEELLSMSHLDITHPDDQAETRARSKSIKEGKSKGYEIEKRYVRKDGEIITCHTSVNVIEGMEDDSIIVVGHLLDISARKRGEQEMQRMRTYLKNIIDSMPSVLVGVDLDGHITEWNTAAKQITGVEPDSALGKGFSDLLPHLKSQMEQVHQAIKSGEPVKTEKLMTERDGETLYSDVMVYPLVANGAVGAVVRVDDVTATVRIQEMMVQTEKMLSVGGLAAGMAHEINNPLGTILQGCQNIMRRLSLDLPKNREVAEELQFDLEKGHQYFETRGILKFLNLIQEAGSRAAKIVSDMLAFSRRSELHFLPVNLAEMLDTTVELASSDYDLKKKYDFKQVTIERDYDPTLESVECDKTEIEQVVLNLIKNAAQAMAENATSDKPPKILLRIVPEPDYARIEVIDNGPGMDEQTRNRVFEPFFTTKEVGVGTGLGLSVSYFIITDQHGGKLNVESTPGEGTRFIIRLPLHRRKEEE